MRTRQIVDEISWSALRRFPWRWSRMATTQYPALLVNDWVHELMARMVGHGGWRGLALRPREVVMVIKKLRRIRRLNARGKIVIDRFSEQLGYCRRVGAAIVQDGPDWRCRDRIVQHECFHLWQYRNGLHKRPAPKALLEHPAVSNALPVLRNQYDVGDARDVVFEMAAYISAADHAYIGLKRREAGDWLSAYFRQYAVASPQSRDRGVS
jgi:hypothetical protein